MIKEFDTPYTKDDHEVYSNIQKMYTDLESYIMENVNSSRIRSVALTHLETSWLWARESVGRDG